MPLSSKSSGVVRREPVLNLIDIVAVIVDPPPPLARATQPRRRDKWLNGSELTVRGMNDPPSVGFVGL